MELRAVKGNVDSFTVAFSEYAEARGQNIVAELGALDVRRHSVLQA